MIARHSRLVAVFTVMALALVACGSGDSTPDATPTPTSPPDASLPAATEEPSAGGLPSIPPDQDQVVYLGFGGTQEQAFLDVIIPAFEEMYPGVTVELVLGGSLQHLASLTAQRENPEAEVTGGNALTNLAGKQQDLLAELDPSMVPNLEHQYPGAAYEDGIGTIISYQSIGIAYNTEIFEQNGWEPPTSWRDLADPKFEGVLYGPDCAFSFTNFMHPLLAQTWGEDEYDEEGLEQALRDIAPNVGALQAAPAELEAFLASGEAAIAWNSDARTNALKVQGAPVEFVYPDEGATLFENTIDVVNGAPNPDAAQAFLNHLLGEVAQRAFAELSLFGPSRPDVYEALDSEIQELVPGPEQIEGDAIRPVDVEYLNDNLDARTRTCQSILAGG